MVNPLCNIRHSAHQADEPKWHPPKTDIIQGTLVQRISKR